MNFNKFYRGMRGMQWHEAKSGFALFLVRVALAVFLVWTGLLQIETNIVTALIMILAGGMILLGILGPLAAILAFGILILPIILTGFSVIDPELIFAAVVALALFFQPRGH